MGTQTAAKKSLRVVWISWYDYDWNTVQRVAPASGEVYALAVKLTDGNLRVFYVGQTDNLGRRLMEHLSDSEPNECIRNKVKKFQCMFRFAVVESAIDRDKVERALYSKFRPGCNDPDAIPIVEDVDINF